ncbi:phosphoribosyltransferase [Helicobacter cinaedi]|uniref:phosphoribosyltransferase n=1 Tax=Helicobacter cinaedi TaxID=213 RepID=UPI000D7BD5E7|nr:phosphoribosyltransferase [Helicobacter cinaedi]QOQ95933.1 phosphoribosyltransferase [Helicobacter cinaedi]
MKCLVCGRWHWRVDFVICKACLDSIPLKLSTRKLTDSTYAYSFYAYSDVSLLMQSKYQLIGSRVLNLLAHKAAAYFFTHIDFADFTQRVGLVGLDDYPYGAYSHTGVILRAFEAESKGRCQGAYGALKAKNATKYAGESLAFRQNNPKGFYLTRNISYPLVVLVDDIITTGTSLREAISVFSAFDVENESRVESKVTLDSKFATKSLESKVIFCLALCDARE